MSASDSLYCLMGSAGSSWNRRLQRQRFPSPANQRKTPPTPDQHLPADEEEGDPDALAIAAPSAAGLRPRPEVRSLGRNGDQDDLRRRRMDRSSPGHLQDEAPTTVSPKTTGGWKKCTLRRRYYREDTATPTVKVMPSIALDVLGRPCHRNQDWFEEDDEEICNPFAKNTLYKAYVNHGTAVNNAEFTGCRRLVQKRPWEMKDAWMDRKAEELQANSDCNETKNIFAPIKAVYRPCTKGTKPLHSSNTPSAPNRLSTISDDGNNRLLQVKRNDDLHLSSSSSSSSSSSFKETDSCTSYPEGKHRNPATFRLVHKHGGFRAMDKLATTIQKMWHQGQVRGISRTTTVGGLLFADDCAVNSATEPDT
nr:unnamed protein product [Spirometra erinaceieuropaei]